MSVDVMCLGETMALVAPDPPRPLTLADRMFTFADGFIERTDRPGLGVEVDEAAVRAADATARPWRTPVWRHADGSFAEW